jgi:hypothetical protein
VTDGEVKKQLTEILARPEFHSYWEDLWWRWIRKLADGTDSSFKQLAFVWRMSLTLVCLGLLLWVLFGISERYQGSLQDREVRGSPPRSRPRTESSADLARRARRLADEGRPREAGKVLLSAVLRGLADRRRIPWNAALADWDWVRRLGNPAGLSELTRASQALAYGPEANADSFERCWVLSLSFLRLEP